MVVPVANTDNFSIQSISTIFVLSYLYVYRQKIAGTAAPLLAGGKNLLDIQRFAIVEIAYLAAALYHGNGVQT